MKEQVNFRPLNADEVEVRVGRLKNNGASYLLYKDARVDMNILDDVFSPYGWKREHQELKGVIYCGVSIKSPDGEWVTKWDAGAESNTEKEKGEASDSFKRACFNWGIGRELYTAPFIWIPLSNDEVTKKGSIGAYVSKMEVKDGKIVALEIKDENNKVRYSMGKQASQPTQATAQPAPVENDMEILKLIAKLNVCKTVDELQALWDANKDKISNKAYVNAVAKKKETLNDKTKTA